MSELPILIIILILVAFLLRVDFIFYIVYVSMGIYALSFFYTPRSLKYLELRRDFHPRTFMGESLNITITLVNKSRLPIPWLEIREIIPLELRTNYRLSKVITLRGRSTKHFSYQVRGMKRGYYQIGPLQIEAGDFFGFREVSRKLSPDYITVYPRVLSMTELQLPSRLPFGTLASKQRLYQDPTRPIGVRNYEFGDSLRHINWKSSARASKMLVKTYEPAISLETMILLNLNRGEYQSRYRRDTIEWAVVVAASVSAFLIERRQSIGIASNGVDPLLQENIDRQDLLEFDDVSGRLLFNNEEQKNPKHIRPNSGSYRYMPTPLKPYTGRGQLMKILEQLARIEAANTVSFAQWLSSATIRLSWGVTIIALTPIADDNLYHSLHRLKQAGFNPILIIIDPFTNFRRINNKARIFGINAYHATDTESLSGWTQSKYAANKDAL